MESRGGTRDAESVQFDATRISLLAFALSRPHGHPLGSTRDAALRHNAALTPVLRHATAPYRRFLAAPPPSLLLVAALAKAHAPPCAAEVSAGASCRDDWRVLSHS